MGGSFSKGSHNNYLVNKNLITPTSFRNLNQIHNVEEVSLSSYEENIENDINNALASLDNASLIDLHHHMDMNNIQISNGLKNKIMNRDFNRKLGEQDKDIKTNKEEYYREVNKSMNIEKELKLFNEYKNYLLVFIIILAISIFVMLFFFMKRKQSTGKFTKNMQF